MMMILKHYLIAITLITAYKFAAADNDALHNRKKRQLFGLGAGAKAAAPDQILNTCMGWMLGSFLDGLSGGAPPSGPAVSSGLISNDVGSGTPAPSLSELHQMDIPVAEISETTLQKLNPEERRILENLQLLQNQLKYRKFPHHPQLGSSLDQQLSRSTRGLGRPLTHQTLTQPNDFLARQWQKVDGSQDKNVDEHHHGLLRAHSTNPWERSLSSLLPDQRVSDVSNPWQLHPRPESRLRQDQDQRGVMNFFGPIMDKPKNRVIIDTGKNFDRFLVHEAQAQEALGVPMVDQWKTMGAMWNDGDIHVVNSDGNGLLGANVQSKTRGFSIPFRSLLKSLDPTNLSKLGK